MAFVYLYVTCLLQRGVFHTEHDRVMESSFERMCFDLNNSATLFRSSIYFPPIKIVIFSFNCIKGVFLVHFVLSASSWDYFLP